MQGVRRAAVGDVHLRIHAVPRPVGATSSRTEARSRDVSRPVEPGGDRDGDARRSSGRAAGGHLPDDGR